MQTYKVEREDGIEIEGVAFAYGAVIELDSETIIVSDLLAEGSIVPVEVNADTIVEDGEEKDVTPSDDEDVETTNSEDEEEAPEVPAETGTFYNGQKIIGEVEDVALEGVSFKKFSVESGESYTLTAEDFEASTTTA